MDSLTPNATPPVPLEQINMERADGFVVVSSRMDPRRVVPPYKFTYDYTYFDNLNDALDLYVDYQNDEYPGWRAEGICAARHGIPFAALDPGRLIGLANETRAA